MSSAKKKQQDRKKKTRNSANKFGTERERPKLTHENNKGGPTAQTGMLLSESSFFLFRFPSSPFLFSSSWTDA